MTRRRWIADQVSGDRAILLGRNAEHLARSLRVRVGQEFEVSTGQQVRLGRVVQVADDRVELELGDVVSEAGAPKAGAARAKAPHIVVLLSIFKFDRFEWAIEKVTELGVAEIVPVIARRTDTHLASAAVKRVERWRRIALEASQQSRRVSPPEISAPRPLKDALEAVAEIRTADVSVPALKIVLAENERGLTLKQVVAEDQKSGNLIALAIGPEGGWTDDELSAFIAAGWTAASLGNTILRAETAARASLAVVMSELA